MAGKKPAQTIRWPPTGRRMQVAAVDVPGFVDDGWEHVADGGAPADPDPGPPAGVGAGDGDAEAPPPPKRRRTRKPAGG